MTNAAYIAAHRLRRQQHAGLAAAATELLLTCPCCHIPNFSARGLAAHCCRAKAGREKLTPFELDQARASATKPAA